MCYLFQHTLHYVFCGTRGVPVTMDIYAVMITSRQSEVRVGACSKEDYLFYVINHLGERASTTWGSHVPEMYEGRGAFVRFLGRVGACYPDPF